MILAKAFLSNHSTQRVLRLKPGEKGFSLIELVVVIAVLAVLTAIALPNFLGVSEDASARTAQQGVLNAFKECKVLWARNKRTDEEFSVPAITDWSIVAADPSNSINAGHDYGTDQPQTGDKKVECFKEKASRDIYAIPISEKFPIYKVDASGNKHCYSGKTSLGKETFNIGCNTTSDNTTIKGWQ